MLQVFKITYCDLCVESKEKDYQKVCEELVNTIKRNFPDLSKKLKIHLFLHLTDSMMEFGPTSSFNTERLVKASLSILFQKQ